MDGSPHTSGNATGPSQSVLSLNWVLGCTTSAATGVMALSPSQLLYLAGNTVVSFDALKHEQIILRAHRNSIQACALSEDRSVVVTACMGAESSLIVWSTQSQLEGQSPTQQLLARVDTPHEGGTVALDVSADGSAIVTLSAPHMVGETTTQEVTVWRLIRYMDANGEIVADLVRLASHPVPAEAGLQRVISASHVLASPSEIVEAVTTGPRGLAFWRLLTMRHAAHHDGRGRGELRTTSATGADIASHTDYNRGADDLERAQPADDLNATTATNSAGINAESFTLVAAAPSMAGVIGSAAAPSASASQAGRRYSSPHRTEGGGEAASVGGAATTDAATKGPATTQALKGKDKPNTSSDAAASGPVVNLNRRLTASCFLPAAATGPLPVVALTGCDDGSLLMWATPFVAPVTVPTENKLAATSGGHGSPAGGRRGSHAGTGNKPEVSHADQAAIHEATAACAKTLAKLLHLAKYDPLAEAEGATGPSNANRINALRLTPDQRHVALGFEDGAVRMYDVTMRMVAWWEDIQAGPVTSLSFIPGTGNPRPGLSNLDRDDGGGVNVGNPTDALARSPSPSRGSPSPQRRSSQASVAVPTVVPVSQMCLPDFVVSTRRSVVVGVQASSFDLLDPEQRRGEILMEGPDAPVAGLAAYPNAPRLAVAVASGCIQIWDTRERRLLLVRELHRGGGMIGSEADTSGVRASHAQTAGQSRRLSSSTAGGRQQTRRGTGTAAAASKASAAGGGTYTPSCIAIDSAGRTIAVGTTEGYVCFLNPADLSDAQPAIPPPHPTAAPSAITKLVFAADGLHLAACDAARHVYLFRFTRTREREATGTTGGPAAITGRSGTSTGTATGGAGTGAGSPSRRRDVLGFGASARPGTRPKPWEVLDATGKGGGKERKLDDVVVVDAWAYIGRARSHSQAVTGIAFSTPAALARGLAEYYGSPVIPGVEAGAAAWEALPGMLTAENPSKSNPPAATVQAVLKLHTQHNISLLASVGADRRVVLYDVGGSSVSAGLLVAARTRIESGSAIPTSCLWLPHEAGHPLAGIAFTTRPPVASAEYLDAFPVLMVATDAQKLKIVWPTAAESSSSSDVGTNPASAEIRCTVLAPDYGGAITHMLSVPSNRRSHSRLSAGEDHKEGEPQSNREEDIAVITYATDDRVVGVLPLPLTGTPHAYVGVVAHPGPVNGLAVSDDGSQIFSCGIEQDRSATGSVSAHAAASAEAEPGASGSGAEAEAAGNGSVCIWRLERAGLASVAFQDPAVAAADEVEAAIQKNERVLELLEGGKEGPLYASICDMFAYAQIRCQGERSTARRKAGNTLPLSELPAVLRALGYYPSQADIAAMKAEVRATKRLLANSDSPSGVQAQAQAAEESVDLNTLIRLYVNYRPSTSTGSGGDSNGAGVPIPQLSAAFATIAAAVGTGIPQPQVRHQRDAAVTRLLAASKDASFVRWGAMADQLLERGERMTPAEVQACLTALLGGNNPPRDDGVLSAAEFAADILGFTSS